MNKSNLIITILLFILASICFIFFDVVPVTILEDPIANNLLCGFISRIGLSLLFGWMLYQYGGRKMMMFDKTFLKSFVWSLPCFMVAFINFPTYGLITNSVYFTRTDLLGYYTLYIIGVAVVEELIFRGALIVLMGDVFNHKKHKPLFVTLICAIIFSLFHLSNLRTDFSNIKEVLFQCLYTLLIGAMLVVTMLKTKNIWLCMLIHAIFDFGGMLVIYQVCGGDPWSDVVFWVLTIVSGVLCAGHIIFTLIKLEKDYVS